MTSDSYAASRNFGTGVTVSLVLFSILIYTEPALFAVETPSVPVSPPLQQSEKQRLLSSKLRLLDMLINDSPTAARIIDSGDFQAQQRLDAAITAYHEAWQLLERGQLDASERQLNAGLTAAADASRRVVDAQREAELQQKRYQDLSRRVSSYREAFERVVMEKRSTATEALLDQAGVESNLMQAQESADQGNYNVANIYLGHASELLERALSVARHEETLVHELKFDSSAEEYAYENERNQSYRMLIELLRTRKTMSQAGLALINDLIARNEALRQEAKSLAARGDASPAIEKLEAGTENLIRALRVGGTAIP